MKRGKLTAGMCALSLMLLAGCGGRNENASSEDVIVEAVETDNKADNKTDNETKDNTVFDQTGEDADEIEMGFADLTTGEVPKAEGIDESKFTDQLCGEVRTINSAEKFVIISKIYREDGADGGQLAAAPVEGSSDEELITVYFTSEAEYILETGKADGTDVSQTKVSFSDIAEGDELNLTGMFDTRGEEFLAVDVKIVRVID